MDFSSEMEHLYKSLETRIKKLEDINKELKERIYNLEYKNRKKDIDILVGEVVKNSAITSTRQAKV